MNYDQILIEMLAGLMKVSPSKIPRDLFDFVLRVNERLKDGPRFYSDEEPRLRSRQILALAIELWETLSPGAWTSRSEVPGPK